MNTETKLAHTPGPWTLCDDKRYIRADSEDWSGATIAQVKDSNWRYRDDSTLEANAHLIAAAPLLLEALEACMEVAFTGPSSPVSSRDHALWKRNIENQARAVIAKAKGESVTSS